MMSLEHSGPKADEITGALDREGGVTSPCHPVLPPEPEARRTRTLVRSYMYCQPPCSRYIGERLGMAGWLSLD